MKLMEMSCMPEGSSARWVLNDSHDIIGFVGRAGELMDKGFIKPAPGCRATRRSRKKWVAGFVEDDDKLRGYPTRKEALKIFKEDEDED